jgi:hypothetical protein
MRATFGLAGVLLVALTLSLGAQTNVAGEWEITLNTQVGETTWEATFEQEGGTLSGKVDIGDREILPLKGTVEGTAIEFVFVMPDLDGDQPINLSGTIDGDTIEGEDGSFSWYGTGNWTAAKQGS